MGILLVLIPGNPGLPQIPSVDVDIPEGSLQAVDHLAGLGHRQIAFLNGPANSKYGVERTLGFRRGMKKKGLPIRKEMVLASDFTEQGWYEGIKKFLSLTPPPTAVMVINNFSAMGALRAPLGLLKRWVTAFLKISPLSATGMSLLPP